MTDDRERLAKAVEALWIGGGTAFRDSVVMSLHYLGGARGRRALVVLTDGIDEASLLGTTQTLAFAHRAGVAICATGLGLRLGNLGRFARDDVPSVEGSKRRQSARVLMNLGRGSGGLSILISGAGELPAVYRQIERDLRSQYLLSFQSPLQGDDFRRLDVKVRQRGTKVRATAGYYP